MIWNLSHGSTYLWYRVCEVTAPSDSVKALSNGLLESHPWKLTQYLKKTLVSVSKPALSRKVHIISCFLWQKLLKRSCVKITMSKKIASIVTNSITSEQRKMLQASHSTISKQLIIICWINFSRLVFSLNMLLARLNKSCNKNKRFHGQH